MAVKGRNGRRAKNGAWPDSAFWTFSVDLYGQPGVEAACITLQDRHDLDVNLLLWALWLAECGVALDQKTTERAEHAVASWQADVIGPLRSLRRRLRELIEQPEPEGVAEQWPAKVKALRQAILALELDGEHLAQLALGRLGDELKPTRRASAKLAGDNLAHLGRFEEKDRGDLANLLMQVFPDVHQARLDAALDGVVSQV